MTNNELSKRVKSWLWRASIMALTAGVDMLLESYTSLHLQPYITVALGLVLGEVSKYLHNKYTAK